MSRKKVNISAVDLFCGAGGLTYGLSKSGVTVHAGYDIAAECKYPYEVNNGAEFCLKDVADVGGDEILRWYPENHIRLLAGCAPCQPFSTYSQGRDVKKDKKWPLLYQFARLIRESQPELITMENVPDVVKHKVYHDFVSDLEEQGYYTWAKSIYCPDYGMPQIRTRHVLLASKLGRIKLNNPTSNKHEYRTVRETIGGLPHLEAGEQDDKDQLHVSAKLSKLNLERIMLSVEGGSWHDWPEHLIAQCHKKESGKSYSGVYARMRWDSPSPTITTQCYGFGNGRFGHPEQNRAISLREAALLQTFPKSYKFFDKHNQFHITKIGRMIGNAVPVTLGKVIGRSLYKHVCDNI